MKLLMGICAASLLVFMLLLGNLSTQAHAATPTFLPILPTVTSSYGGLYPTPTPLTITIDQTREAAFDTRAAAHSLADSAINVYRAFNTYQIGDLMAFLGMLMFCLLMAIRIIKKLTRTHE